MFMLINDILCVCMLLIYRLCFISTMFIREADHVKPWSSVQLLIIRSSLVTFTLFYFQFLKLEKHKNPCSYVVSFGFINTVGTWQPPQSVGDTKLFVHCCICLKSKEKELTSGFPDSSIITPSHPCGENFSCCVTFCLESQRVALWRIGLLSSLHTSTCMISN
jgi:hypothetical protein